MTSRGFLGLTVGCARCHDHKFDPISTEDYYALAGVFYNTDYHEYPVAPESSCAVALSFADILCHFAQSVDQRKRKALPSRFASRYIRSKSFIRLIRLKYA